jgi:signal transduction histidine kinase
LTVQFVALVLIGYFLMFGMSTWLLTGMNQALRRGEQRLLRRSVASDRLSDLRRDFLRIASHNLRSPIGAATVLLRNLKEGLGGPLSQTQEEWVTRCLHRLEDLSEFLHDLRVLAELQSGVVEEQAQTVGLGSLLTQLVDEQKDFAREKEQELSLELQDDLSPVKGIERLLREAVVNYIQNAIRFTPTGGRITVRASSSPYVVRVEVEDSGIGISEENQDRLFTAFARIRNDQLGEDFPEGTGLGLSIVLRIAEFHSGRVGVSSTPGEGSLFYLELPAAAE